MTALEALHRELGLTVQETLDSARQRNPQEARELAVKYASTLGAATFESLLKVSK